MTKGADANENVVNLNRWHCSAAEIARIFGVSASTVRTWAKNRECPTRDVEPYLFYLPDVVKWYNDRGNDPVVDTIGDIQAKLRERIDAQTVIDDINAIDVDLVNMNLKLCKFDERILSTGIRSNATPAKIDLIAAMQENERKSMDRQIKVLGKRLDLKFKLLGKTLPDMKAITVQDDDGNDILTKAISHWASAVAEVAGNE